MNRAITMLYSREDVNDLMGRAFSALFYGGVRIVETDTSHAQQQRSHILQPYELNHQIENEPKSNLLFSLRRVPSAFSNEILWSGMLCRPILARRVAVESKGIDGAAGDAGDQVLVGGALDVGAESLGILLAQKG